MYIFSYMYARLFINTHTCAFYDWVPNLILFLLLPSFWLRRVNGSMQIARDRFCRIGVSWTFPKVCGPTYTHTYISVSMYVHTVRWNGIMTSCLCHQFNSYLKYFGIKPAR